mgnify:CR=1 FL=1
MSGSPWTLSYAGGHLCSLWWAICRIMIDLGNDTMFHPMQAMFLCDNVQMSGCLKWAKWTALSSKLPLQGDGHACSEILRTAFRSMTPALLQVLLPIYSMGKCLGDSVLFGKWSQVWVNRIQCDMTFYIHALWIQVHDPGGWHWTSY